MAKKYIIHESSSIIENIYKLAQFRNSNLPPVEVPDRTVRHYRTESRFIKVDGNRIVYFGNSPSNSAKNMTAVVPGIVTSEVYQDNFF